MIDRSKIDFEELIYRTKGRLYLSRTHIGYRTDFDNINVYKFNKLVCDVLDQDNIKSTPEDIRYIVEIMCTLDDNIKCEFENAKKVSLNEIIKMHREFNIKPYIPISLTTYA